MLRYVMTTLLAMTLMCLLLGMVGCGGGAGGSFGGNNVSKQFTIDLSGVSFAGPQAEVPVDVDGDGQVDGVIKGGVIIWIADVITQTDSGLLAGATLAPGQGATSGPGARAGPGELPPTVESSSADTLEEE